MALELKPLSFREACRFIDQHHAHHDPPQGHKFSIGVTDDGDLVGVIVVGRPVNRHRDDGYTAEVTRCCTDGTKNAASKLYAAAWRAARAMGYDRIGTYTLQQEEGTSLEAAGWEVIHQTDSDSWDTPARERETTAPTCQKVLWEQRKG